MLGIVLCGGQSSRMGADKGLLIHQNKRWSKLAGEKLGSLNLQVKFSINVTQIVKYSAYYDEMQLIKDQASFNVSGPLSGVLSAHAENPDDDLFLMACDLLMMEVGVLERLVAARREEESFDVYLFSKDNQQEPLCGIYTAAGLKKIKLMLERGELMRHSMKFVLSKLRVYESILESDKFHCFGNFNSPLEINKI